MAMRTFQIQISNYRLVTVSESFHTFSKLLPGQYVTGTNVTSIPLPSQSTHHPALPNPSQPLIIPSFQTLPSHSPSSPQSTHHPVLPRSSQPLISPPFQTLLSPLTIPPPNPSQPLIIPPFTPRCVQSQLQTALLTDHISVSQAQRAFLSIISGLVSVITLRGVPLTASLSTEALAGCAGRCRGSVQ